MRLRKKLIATGWDCPDSERLLTHLAEMEKRPFDGVILELTGRTAEGKFSAIRPAFSREKWQREWFQASVDQLRACKFTRLTDNFITIGANPGSVDWFDDEGWQRIVEHWRIAAWAAKQSGCKGLLFDPEPYTPPHSQFSYAAQPDRKQHSFNEYAAKARQRGRQVMQAIAEEYPEITLFCYFINSINAAATGRADPIRCCANPNRLCCQVGIRRMGRSNRPGDPAHAGKQSARDHDSAVRIGCQHAPQGVSTI
jgi:hypothetical protein